MRYGGPRMLLVSPIQVIRHMYLEWKDKKEASHASLFLMVLSRFHVIILCDCFVQYSFD